MRSLRGLVPLALGGLVALAACGGGGGGGGGGGAPADPGGGSGGGGATTGSGVPEQPAFHVFATSEDAVSWVHGEHATFGFLPPHTVLRAQVVRRDAGGRPALLGGPDVDVTYDAVADADGAVNARSLAKTDLWTLRAPLPFGVALARGAGLFGRTMPGDAASPGPQAFAFDAERRWFRAAGIPAFPIDDAGRANELPRWRVTARDHATGAELGHADVTAPVSSKNGCVLCHATGGSAAARGGVVWSTAADPEKQAKENVLRAHDLSHGTTFSTSGAAVVCGICHDARPNVLTDAPAGTGLPSLSAAIHRRHASVVASDGGAASCAICHPSSHLLRGAMGQAGLSCGACHGTMDAVAGTTPLAAGGSLDGRADGASRRAWVDAPRCESCHTGDALDHATGAGLAVAADGLRLTRAFVGTDAAASPIRRDASRFSPGAGVRYRDGTGHAGLACQACHGGAHAELSRAGGSPLDDAAAIARQGHPGALVECEVCHVADSLPLTTAGPHGLHNVGDPRWALGGHATFYAADPAGCEACHGKDLAGTVLSQAAAERVRDLGGGRVVTIAKGQAVACGLCHASHPTTQAWVAADHGTKFTADPAACEGCHGADLAGTALSKTVADRSFTVGAKTVSLPRGTTVGCAACHVPHATNLAWVDGAHASAYATDPAGCAMCHGKDLGGTALSQAAANRTYTVGGATYAVKVGDPVACATCHVPHDTSATFVSGTHGSTYAANPAACTICHGKDLAGTALSTTAAARSYTVGGKTYALAAGAKVACATCHVPHATTLTWVSTTHGANYAASPADCTMCHGANLAGTSFSTTAASRSYTVDGKTYALASGATVGCASCHVSHATTSTWVSTTHGPSYERDAAACRNCHGADLKGSVMTKTAASRSFTFGKKTVAFTSGQVVDCAACHVPHATTSTFAGSHMDAYDADPVSCKTCHGHTLAGTSLSITAAKRTLTIGGRSYTLQANTKVACDLCHSKP